MIDYCNLHTHSEFSLLDGAARIDSLAKTAKEFNHKYLALTDHGSTSGLFQHKKACEKNDVNPLYGVELYMIEDIAKSQEGQYLANLHLTAIAKNQKGFQSLLKGLHWANKHGVTKKGRFKRAFLSPTFPLENDWAGNVIILSGCANSPFYNLKESDGISLMEKYREAFKDDFYGELMPLHDYEDQKNVNEIVIEASKALGMKMVATNDIHYCKQEESALHDLIICMGQHAVMSDPNRWRFTAHTNYFRSGEDMLESFVKMGMPSDIAKNSLLNTLEIGEKASFKLQPYPIDLPNPSGFEGQEEIDYFLQKCADGIKTRGLEGDVYWARLEKESSILIDKKFVRYFLIVADMIQWAKSHGVFVGPGRGSVGGSLVAYVLGITELDPIRYNLPFERFVAPDRLDLPDIDIDIEDKNRILVEQYLKERYGTNNVAHVSTFMAMQGRAALRDVARAMSVPLDEVDDAAKKIIKRVEGHPRFYKSIEDTINTEEEFRKFALDHPCITDAASKLEGQIRSMGVHAGGLVLSPVDFDQSDNCYLIKNDKGQHACNWDKDDLDFFGMVKIDLLGLSTHSVISATIREIKARHDIDVDLAKMPLDDKKVYEAIGKGETATMFQLSAPGTASYCKEMKPSNYEEIAAVLALWRPGPIQSGMASAYVDVKFGKKNPVYLCKEHKDVAEKTKGQLIYQEQLTELVMRLAGFTYVQADKVRKIAAKKLGAEAWQTEGEKFIKGCIEKKTISEEAAKELWKRLEGWAAYGFNAAHAYAYALVAYWSGWLKIHYPAEWICSYLNYGSTERETKEGESNLDIALMEARRMNIAILPPDINESLQIWKVQDSLSLRAGLQEIKNLGEKTLGEIVSRKAQFDKFTSFSHFMSVINRRLVNVRAIRSLLHAGALDSLSDQDWKSWKANFDDLYQSFDPLNPTSPKFLNILEKSKAVELKTPESYLNYNESALQAIEDSANDIVNILGDGYELEGGMIVQKSDGKSWSISDVRKANMPGLKARVVKESGLVGIKKLREDAIKCDLCRLRKTCTKPVPIEQGILNAMIVAEAPGYYEDKKGKPLVGKSGELLFPILADLGLERNLFFIENTVHCRPPDNKMKDFEFVNGCPHLTNAILAVKPKIILSLGGKALYYFKKKESGIMNLSGTTEWDGQRKCWITYCVHPSMVLHGKEGSLELFKRGLEEFARATINLMGT